MALGSKCRYSIFLLFFLWCGALSLFADSNTVTIESARSTVYYTDEVTEDEIIVVTVGDPNATGNVTITIGDYTNKTELDENGQARFNVTGLVVDHYIVEANYSGDANDENRDAFYGARIGFKATGIATSETVKL